MFVQTSKKVLESGGLSYKLLGNFIGISVYTDLKYLKMKGLCSYRLKNGGLSHNVLELRFYDSVSLSFK